MFSECSRGADDLQDELGRGPSTPTGLRPSQPRMLSSPVVEAATDYRVPSAVERLQRVLAGCFLRDDLSGGDGAVQSW